MVEKLEEGSFMVGAYIYDNMNPRHKNAEVSILRKELYIEWCGLYQKQYPSHS